MENKGGFPRLLVRNILKVYNVIYGNCKKSFSNFLRNRHNISDFIEAPRRKKRGSALAVSVQSSLILAEPGIFEDSKKGIVHDLLPGGVDAEPAP